MPAAPTPQVLTFYVGKDDTERKYYKYTYSNFVQPVLTSNVSDPSFIVTGTSDTSNWKLYDGSTSTGYTKYSAGSRPAFTSYISLDKPTCFTGFTVEQRKDNDDNRLGHYYILSYSDDGINYTDIINTGLKSANQFTQTFENDVYCRYYKFYASPKGGSNNDEINVKEFSFTGTVRDAVESTESDYDFYIDKPLTSLAYENHGTKTQPNYNINILLRPNVVQDTITCKQTSSGMVLSSSSIGTIKNASNVYSNIDTTKAFNPTLGTKKVRPRSATFKSTTVSSQFTNAHIHAYNGSSSSINWGDSLYIPSSPFAGNIKDTYDITWSYIEDSGFNYWWAFAPFSLSYQSGTQTLAGTFNNIVWEVEGSGDIIDERYYAL